jgi:hypothetical protein
MHLRAHVAHVRPAFPTHSTSASSREAHLEVAFALQSAISGKLAKKHGENRRKSGGNGAEWRPFRRPRAPFRRAPFRLRSIATLSSARPYAHGLRLPFAASEAGFRKGGAIFPGPVYETIYIRITDLTIASVLSRVGRLARSIATVGGGTTVGRIGNPSHESLGPGYAPICRSPSAALACGSAPLTGASAYGIHPVPPGQSA